MLRLIKSASLTAVAAIMTLTAGSLYADDTDIYVNRTPPSGAEPLVMFSLDFGPPLTSAICANASAASCTAAAYFRSRNDPFLNAQLTSIGSGKFYFIDLLRLALYVVTINPEFQKVKLGFMMSHNSENNCVGPNATECSNGGAILSGFKSLSEESTRTAFQGIMTKLRQLKDGGNAPDHTYQGAELFFEFYRYLTGGLIYNGHNGAVDFEKGNGIDRSSNMDAYSPASWDPAIERAADRKYISPLENASKCTRAYTLNFLFGNSFQDADSNTAASQPVGSGGLGVTLPRNDPFETVISRLNTMDVAPGLEGVQNVTSYFFVKAENQANKVSDYAAAGGTVARAAGDNPEALVEEISAIFREILATSTTFVAASVPVNVFNRASVVNNVYIALFEADAKPYWIGNVKKLKIDTTNLNDPILVDALSQNAVVADGRIRFDAQTFWTNSAALTDQDVANNIFAGRDGRHVDRGGGGQKIPGFLSATPTDENSDAGARKLFYLNGSTLTALDATATNSTNAAIQSQLGSTGDSAKTLKLLQYARGFDSYDEDGDTNVGERRTWLFADPLHSRPLPINYGDIGSYTQANPGIFIAIGSNDGYIRLIRNTTTGGQESGEEVWAFMPPEGMAVQERLAINLADVNNRHPYSVDGAPAALVMDLNQDGRISGSDRVVLLFGLRRGGTSYYAIDITNPESPSFLWRASSASADFTQLGMSFSQPKVGVVRNGGADIPAVFFTGGYDTNKDAHAIGTNDSRGRGVYVVNALTGALIWKAVSGGSTGSVSATTFSHAQLLDGVPSDPTIVDTNGDGLVDRVLFGDTGGKIWRADIGPGDSGTWKLSLLANIGRHFSATRANDRRFFHEPDIVRTRDADGRFDAVVVGSGDRPNPLDYPTGGTRPQNWFYMIKDRNTAIGSGADSALDHDDLADITSGCLLTQSATDCGIASELRKGWRLQMATDGEKVLAAPLTIGGTVFFTSYIPTTLTDSCAPSEGTGRQYAVSLLEGNPVFADYNAQTDLQVSDRYQQLDSPGIPAQVVFVPGMPADKNILRPDLKFVDAPSSGRLKTFWYRVGE